jgi:hypothetical protein
MFGNYSLHPSAGSTVDDDFDAKVKKVIVSRPRETVKPFCPEKASGVVRNDASGYDGQRPSRPYFQWDAWDA